MYEKTIKFKLEKKFFNQSGFLDNKYVYDWMNLAKKYYLNGLGIDIDSLINYDLYYADIDVKILLDQISDTTAKISLLKHGLRNIVVLKLYFHMNSMWMGKL